MKNHQEILESIIARGGLLGICAERYIGNEQLAIQYIIELSEQCHVSNIQEIWGAKLINDIITFSSHYELDDLKEKSKDDP